MDDRPSGTWGARKRGNLQRRRGWPCLLLVLVMPGAAACSGDAGGGGSPTSVPALTTTLSPAEVAKAKARAVVLTAADLPGFTKAVPEPEDDRDPFVACAKVAPTAAAVDGPNAVAGDEYERGLEGAVTVSSSGDVLEPAVAGTLLKELASSQLAACFQRAFRTAINSELPAGASVTVKVVPGWAPVAGAEQTASLDVQGTLSAAGARTLIHFRIDAVRKQGTVAFLEYGAFGEGYDQAEHSRLLALITSRL